MKRVHPAAEHDHARSPFARVSLGALGVVYGDIGTSPLYTIHEVFAGSGRVPLTPENVVGVISLVLWALMVVVSLKYVTLILRADNHGEGGIMALLALATSAVHKKPALRQGLLYSALFGAALFYGDGIITPAISVLSAMEGLEVGASALKPYVVPLTVIVLIALFAFQRRGTSHVGAWFGPIMLAWFGVLAATGLIGILAAPQILAALNPWHGIRFMLDHRLIAFVGLGAIVLALTGAEALYADMGHFGRKPIRAAWFAVVAPALALNYLGQGALILSTPSAINNPFYNLVHPAFLYPMIALATVATVIASQAVISGAFSMTHQAIQLGFLPRVRVVQTSSKQRGQIYLPFVNWSLLFAVIAVVLGFGSSTSLASAYGVAVTGTMLITTIITFFVVRYCWHYPWWLSVLATGFFLCIDAAFFCANALKVLEGGWLPFAIGVTLFLAMATWERGRRYVYERLSADQIPLAPFLESLADEKDIYRPPTTAVYLVANPDGVPRALLHNLAHNHVLHQRIIFLNVEYRDIPFVPRRQQLDLKDVGHGCFVLRLHYGFMDTPDIPEALSRTGFHLDTLSTSYFISRETLIPTDRCGMPRWRQRLFAAQWRLGASAVEFFNVPANRVIELGVQVEI